LCILCPQGHVSLVLQIVNDSPSNCLFVKSLPTTLNFVVEEGLPTSLKYPPSIQHMVSLNHCILDLSTCLDSKIINTWKFQ
jgi:hypothetical protein